MALGGFALAAAAIFFFAGGTKELPVWGAARQRHRGAVGGGRAAVRRVGGGLELTLLLAEGDPQRYERAAVRWHVRFLQETKNVDPRESLAVLALLAAIPANRLAAIALAELLGRLEARCGARGPSEAIFVASSAFVPFHLVSCTLDFPCRSPGPNSRRDLPL
jgi:hypothetical protein